jgi:predicted PurR-regulated permease PerM
LTPREQLAGYDDAESGTSVDVGAAEEATPALGTAPASELRTLLALAVAAIVVTTLYIAQDVLVPITLAVMLSFVLSPLVDGLRRAGLWRAPAVALTVVVALAAIGLVGTLLGSQAAALATDVPRYVEAVQTKVERIQAFAVDRVASLTQFVRIRPPLLSSEPMVGARRGTVSVPALPAGTTQQPVVVQIAPPPSSILGVARAVIEPVLGPLEKTVVVLIVAIFILVQREDLRDRFIRLVGPADLHRTTMAMDDAGQRLSRYFVAQLTVNTCFGFVIGAGLWLIGIPSPALWGAVAGLLRFVPYIGAVMAAVAPLMLAAAVDPGWWTAIDVALLFVIVEPLTGYLIEPLLYARSTGLSPVAVIVAAIFWTALWGPVGLILSTALTLCLVVMGRHVKSLEFFDVLLGDRPALSEVNRFYQRTLANDPDEALDQAETMLADRPLVDYYDGVVLQGLKLAAQDEASGTISPQRAAGITRSMLTVVRDLDGHVDADHLIAAQVAAHGPLQHATSASVLCVAGRSPFDEVVSAMLGQLLAARGMGSRMLPHSMVSREKIAQLDFSGASVIIVSSLAPGVAPAHVRYLIQRLRQRAPMATIIAGLWSLEELALNDPTSQRALGADRYVASLRDALDAALAAIREFAATFDAAGHEGPLTSVIPRPLPSEDALLLPRSAR